MKVNRRAVIGACVPGALLAATGAVRAGHPLGGGGDACWLFSLQEQWAKALQDRDPKSLDKILAADFGLIDPSGHVWEREKYLASVSSDQPRFTSIKVDDLAVKLHQGIAVVTGVRQIEAGEQGANLAGRFRFTNTFIFRGDDWVCIAS
jgi:hypothetical protein